MGAYKNMQQSVLFPHDKIKKRIRYKQPSFTKNNSILDLIKKDNIERHIFRYTTLYKIYSKLYLMTFQKPLSILEYYIEEDGFFYAEIKNSSHLNMYIKERLLMHIDLLRKIKNNDPTLQYIEKKEIKTVNAQLSLFS